MISYNFLRAVLKGFHRRFIERYNVREIGFYLLK